MGGEGVSSRVCGAKSKIKGDEGKVGVCGCQN